MSIPLCVIVCAYLRVHVCVPGSVPTCICEHEPACVVRACVRACARACMPRPAHAFSPATIEQILYPLTNMFTTFLSLSTMWSCMLLTMLAPGKALHGSPDEFAYILRVVRSAGLAPAHALCTPDSGTHALTPPRERTQAHPRALMHVHARGRSHACTRTHTRGVSWAALPTSAQLSSDSAVFPSPPARCLLPFCPQHAVPVSCASHYHEIPCGPISPAQTFG
eukprot:3728655-Pleurochrysis_carterae.AAC.2